MDYLKMLTKVLLAVTVLAALGAIAAPVLAYALAAGGPKSSSRFRVKPVAQAHLRMFVDTMASFSVTSQVAFPHSPERLWTALLDERAYSWLPFVKGVSYLDDQQSVGSRRAVVGTFLALQEQIIAFEEGQRIAFSVTGASLYGLAAGVQEYVITPTAKGGSLLTWTVAGSPKFVGFLPLRLTSPFVRPFMKRSIKGVGQLT
jgi:uncharacterized membrane protein